MFVDSGQIKDLARRVGFDACGICDAVVDDSEIARLASWLDKSYNAGMGYMSRNADVRANPGALLDGAKSVISVLLSYNTDEKPEQGGLKIAKYAYGRDYHLVVKEKLCQLLAEIKRICPEAEGRPFVDSAPVLERYFAKRAGLGFIGRNRCLISPKYGSFVFIGELVVNFECDYDRQLVQRCLNCNACVKFCPTHALTFEGVDARKCISYHTIENRDEIPEEVNDKLGNRYFGCDACQDCCPHNISVPKKNGILLPEINAIQLDELESMSNRQFQKKYGETALSRAGREKIVAQLRKANLQNRDS